VPWAPDTIDKYPSRNAERGLEGMELGLPWDYAASVMLPTMCCLTLVLVSSYVYRIFRGLTLWALFYYMYCRYIHLRFMRMQYFTTSRVDSNVNIAWGLPLSVIAASWVVWAWRTGVLPDSAGVKVKVLVTGLAFASSFMLWICCYLYTVRPFTFDFTDRQDRRDPHISETKAQTLYSWFNCNPVYTLKCKHYIQHMSAEEREKFDNPLASGHNEDTVRFFEVGKEFLFMPTEYSDKVHAMQNDQLEFETYLDAMVMAMEGDRRQVNFLLEQGKENVAKGFEGLPTVSPIQGHISVKGSFASITSAGKPETAPLLDNAESTAGSAP